MNLTIAACDPMDGLTDGVISRSDLCKLNFDLNSTIGQAYSCAAEAASGAGGFASLVTRGINRRQLATPATPAQNGTVTAEGVAVASAYLNGFHNSKGERVYLSYQPGAQIADAATTYDSTTDTWGLDISGLGGEWVARFLELQDASTLSNLDNITYDTIETWMKLGMNRYGDSLQTTYPDLTDFKTAGGKVIHIHGEQDNSIPTASSVHYYESVREVMYGNLTFNESTAALDDFYRLYLVPGGAHCGSNTYQSAGGWPASTLQTVIDWVETSVAPDTLNNSGTEINTLCRYPLRPLWSGNSTTFDCVYDQTSIDSWNYTFDAYNTPLY
jgi:tannase